jgi:hypothetical protein
MRFSAQGRKVNGPLAVQWSALPLHSIGDVGPNNPSAFRRADHGEFLVANRCAPYEDARALRSIGKSRRCMYPPGVSLSCSGVVRFVSPVRVEVAQVEDEPLDHNDDECPEDEHPDKHKRHREY